MYKLFLILKYLRKRRIAWVSLIAVMLCTTMVLVVISVMGGWLRMFRESFHSISGDIVVTNDSLGGFAYYDEMIDKIQKLPDVDGAGPFLRSFGLINILGQQTKGIQVIGIPIDRISKINDFGGSLYRQYQGLLDEADDRSNDLTPQQRSDLRKQAQYNLDHPSFKLPLPPELYREILKKSTRDPSKFPGLIAGASVIWIHKNQEGQIVGRRPDMYEWWIKVTVVPVAANGHLSETPESQTYWLVDDSRTKTWQNDAMNVYVPFDVLQQQLQMTATTDEPARTSEIRVKAKQGVDLTKLESQIQKIVDEVMQAHAANTKVNLSWPEARSWYEENAKFLNAVENEKSLVTMLFGIISIVAIFLIFCIFYMIVAEKTKDIGIIKSVGATNSGVAGIFLGYGLTIGIVGGALGLLVGYGIVHNINYLHSEFAKITGAPIWDPEVYMFDTIPNTMNPKEVAVIVSIAVVASVIGALVPAIRAARMNPVESLRYE